MSWFCSLDKVSQSRTIQIRTASSKYASSLTMLIELADILDHIISLMVSSPAACVVIALHLDCNNLSRR